MPIERRLTIRERNFLFEQERFIAPQPTSIITYTISPQMEINDADTLLGKTWASPDPIGSSTPAGGAFSSLSSTNVNFDGGTVDNVVIGSSVAAGGAFSSLSSTNAVISGGAISNTPIGTTAAAGGKFSTLESTGISFSGGSIDGVAIGSTTPAAGTFAQLIASKMRNLATSPATASSTGVYGDIALSSEYVYVCLAADLWGRTALTTW